MIRRNKKAFALGRLKSGEMNRVEAAYAAVLKDREHSGEVLWWRFEPITLKLAENTRYTPDFFAMLDTGELVVFEVKGSMKYIQDDAKVKIKVAGDMFPMRFYLVAPDSYMPKNKPYMGGWEIREVGVK